MENLGFKSEWLVRESRESAEYYLELGRTLWGYFISDGEDPDDDVGCNYPSYDEAFEKEFGLDDEKANQYIRAYLLINWYRVTFGHEKWTPPVSVLKHLGSLLFPNLIAVRIALDDLRLGKMSNNDFRAALNHKKYRHPTPDLLAQGYRLELPKIPFWFNGWPEQVLLPAMPKKKGGL